LKLGVPKYKTGMQTIILLCPTLLLLLLFTANELQKDSINNTIQYNTIQYKTQ